ncbi:hypothetical protein BC833DRAFT_533792, partial [Globomyces pollinis-pini]
MNKFEWIIEQICDTSESLVTDLTAVSGVEQEQLLAFGTGPKAGIAYQCAHYAFEEIARNEPDLIAVEHEDRSITYGELNKRAEQIACLLMDRGVQVGDYVGLVTTRSIEMICGIFGILKAGGAYIPIDHELPLERIQYMLELADCSTILYHTDIRQEALDCLDSSKTVSLVEATSHNHFTPPVIRGDSPAYVVFTSGSTGKPKGVIIKHSSCCNFISANPVMIDANGGDKIAQNAAIGFDVAIAEIFLALSFKATLVLREEKDYFSTLKKVNKAFITPTGLSKLDPKLFVNLKKVVLAGENFNESLISKWTHVQFINAYGPTETTLGSNATPLNTSNIITIGKPITNTNQYIVDRNLQLVPIGVPGELVIGGAGVALGYLNRPDLTAEKFIHNHFLNNGSKMYRTGDICKWTEDGNIQILGRSDDMVKVKGYRIELDEVSSAISRHPDVTGSAVIVKDDQLIAFVTPDTVS